MPLLLAWIRPGSVSVQGTLLAACLLLGGACVHRPSRMHSAGPSGRNRWRTDCPSRRCRTSFRANAGASGSPSWGGLVQFDGHTFTAFTSAGGLPSDLITALHQDTSGVLWVGTRRGLFHFDGSTYERRSATASLTMAHHSLEVAERSPADCTFHQCEAQGAKRR